jgi:hypothetical protein
LICGLTKIGTRNYNTNDYDRSLEELQQMEDSEDWKKVTRTNYMIQCPCCDYFTLDQRGQYHICNICFWEDDGIDLDEPDLHSGPNHMTLRQGRSNFLTIGACEAKMLKNVIDKKERTKFKYIKRSID